MPEVSGCKDVNSCLLTLAPVAECPAFLLRVKTPSLPFSRDAIIPAPTVPVGAVLDSTQGIFTVPQPLCLLTRAPWGQIGLKDQRPREVKSQPQVTQQDLEFRIIHLGSSVQLGNGKPI